MITCAVLQVSKARQFDRRRFGMRLEWPDLIAIALNPSPIRRVQQRCANMHRAVRQQARRDRFG
jgi:hypothetical protein